MNILLIPFSEQKHKHWKNAFQYCQQKGDNIYVIFDGNEEFFSLNKPKEFTVLDCYITRLMQPALSIFDKIILLRYINTYAKHILKLYKIDALVVCNDRGLMQNIFVNIAKKLNIRNFLYQTAIGYTYPKPLTLYQKIKTLPTKLLFNFSADTRDKNLGNYRGSSVDMCLLQGKYWSNLYDNNNCLVVGNSHYRQLQKEKIKIKLTDINYHKEVMGMNDKKVVTFFSQPFYEESMSTPENIKNLYLLIEQLQDKINQSDDFVFVFRPHPRDKYYLNFNFQTVKDKVNLTSLIYASDVCLSVFSSVAIESRIANKTTLSFAPPLLDDSILQSIRLVYHGQYNNIDKLYDAIISETGFENNNDLNDIFNLSINTEEAVYNAMHQKIT